MDLDKRAPEGRFLAVQVIDFGGVRAARERWVASGLFSSTSDLVFAKAMTPIGSRASAGFGAGVPDLGRQVLITVWRRPAAFADFLAHPVMRRLSERAAHWWWVVAEVVSTRGSSKKRSHLWQAAIPTQHYRSPH